VGTFHKLLKGLGSACALAGMAFVASSASANLVPLFQSVTTAAGVSTFSYNITIDNQEDVHTGDYFVIYDFDQYVPGSAVAPAGWTVTVANSGPIPAGLVLANGPDSASLPNLEVMYTGSATILGPSSGPPVSLGAFTAQSTAPFIEAGQYASEAHFQTNLGGAGDKNQGITTVPTAGVTPEGSSLALLLPGLVPVGLALRRRIKRA